MSITPYPPILAAIQSKKPFTLSEENKITPTTHEDTSRFCRIASYLSECLAKEVRLSPQDALKHDAISATSLFLRTVPQSEKHQSIESCKVEKKAFSLGIPSQALSLPQNQGFAKFAEKPPLERYLAFYGDSLKVDQNGAILMRHQNKITPWEEIKKQITPLTPPPIQYQAWTYGPKGAQENNIFAWTQLEPFRITPISSKEPPSYAIKICSCLANKPRYGGDHTWVELISRENSEQKEYSVGLYSSSGIRSSKQKDRPLRLRPGFLQSPDCSRWFPDTIYEIERSLTKEQFSRMITKIEKDKANEMQGIHIPIQLMGDNCTRYAVSVAELELTIPSVQEHFLSLINQRHGSPLLENLIKRTLNTIPRPLASTVEVCIAGIFHSLLILYGASIPDEKVKAAVPFLAQRGDIFNPHKKMHTDHPWGVRRVALEEEAKQKERMQITG